MYYILYIVAEKLKVGTTIKYKKDYLDNKELSNDVIESIYHNDGRVVKDDSVFKYEYWIKDHLGNVRVTFADDNSDGIVASNEVRSRNDYYTFGMEMNSRWKLAETYHLQNQKKYNGKEWVNEMNLGQLLYGKRPYNPILGRFESVDPISHMFPSLSSYNYASNNPIRNIDLHGLQGVDAVAGALVGDDNKGYIKTASKTLREDSPRLAGLQDAAFAILDFIGFNHIDNVYFGDQPTTTAEKVAAVVPLLFNTKGTVDEGMENVVSVSKNAPKVTTPYKRPSNATTKEMREYVNEKGKEIGCTTCGKKSEKYIADHKTPLVEEYYNTGSIDKNKMKSKDSVQPQCPECSAKQGAEMSKYSKEMKKILNGLH